MTTTITVNHHREGRECVPRSTLSSAKTAQKNCLQFTQTYPWINYPTSLFRSYA